MVEENDRELIRSYLNGSDAAFERLYERYKRPLYGYLLSMLPTADADDVFQQTWVRACAALPGYHCRGKFQAWLFRIARNQAVDLIRHRSRRSELESEYTPEPKHQAVNEELKQQLEEALRQLGPEQRAVFQMRRKNLSFRIIAAEQQCTVNTAVRRMHYAIDKLKKMLKQK